MDFRFLTPLLLIFLIIYLFSVYSRFLRRQFPPPEGYRESGRIGVRVGVRLLRAIPPIAVLSMIFGSIPILISFGFGPRIDISVLMLGGAYVSGELLALLIARLGGRDFQAAYLSYHQHTSGTNMRGIQLNLAAAVLLIVLLAAYAYLRFN